MGSAACWLAGSNFSSFLCFLKMLCIVFSFSRLSGLGSWFYLHHCSFTCCLGLFASSDYFLLPLFFHEEYTRFYVYYELLYMIKRCIEYVDLG